MKHSNPTMRIVILTAVITIFFVASGYYIWNKYDFLGGEKIEDNGWLTYTSEQGFSFDYPEGYEVSENVDPENSEITNVFISSGEGPPNLQINISPYSVSFSLWEGIPWDGYPEIVKTFEME